MDNIIEKKAFTAIVGRYIDVTSIGNLSNAKIKETAKETSSSSNMEIVYYVFGCEYLIEILVPIRS